MMGSENNEEAHLQAPREGGMESVALDDGGDANGGGDCNGGGLTSNYRSAMPTLSSSFSSSSLHHPLSVPTPADSDPLLAPPSPSVKSPNSIKIANNHHEKNSYLDHPSYADVIFSPLDEPTSPIDSNGGSPDGDSNKFTFSSRSQSDSSEYLEIVVSHPQKEAQASASIVPGNNTYVTYLITTKTNLADYGGSEFSVRRRFKDVVTLSDRLTEAYRGFFIPPRPDKSIVESQVMHKQEFVEQRRVALEKYLRRLAGHPVLKKSDELRVFLQVQGKLPLPTSVDVTSRMLDGAAKLPKQLFGDSTSVMGPQDVVQPAKGGRDLLRLFKELKQSVANDWVGSRPPAEEEDKEFLEKKLWLNGLEQHLSNASKQAESLVKAQQDLGETMGELGLALIKLTKFENEEALLNTQRVRAADMKNLATTVVKASRYHRGLNAQTVKHLDTLHEYMGLMWAMHNAFSDRSSALLTVQTLLSELSSLRSRAEKLETASSKIFGGDKSRIRKSEELKEAIRNTEDAKCCAIREYERIKENNKSEIERLDKERKTDFLVMLKGFVSCQVRHLPRYLIVFCVVTSKVLVSVEK
ncbi:OLC1v1006358C1 [Oldenlandia corymbosa var. corymbosa]|uniref:OLC1v1006358C1 n=1 Tax=Oldenlandia corymbosa var. corymbosa TaxID=529605 RepID=A0AAV1DIY2_OLDCO|nr:OLC1v1006358C1 [Oldenlandia corymbosa var. corymbosa]